MLKSVFLLGFLTICLIGINYGQQGILNTEISTLGENDFLVLPQLDNDVLKARYQHNTKNTSNKFAEAREVHANPKENGIWEATKSGQMVWRFAIKSPTAYSLNLGFTQFHLPQSAELFIYNTQKTEILGPFSAKDNDDHRQLWTPIISGDEIIVELQMNANDREDFDLVLSRVNHDFKNLRKNLQSGSCNLDVVCGAADGYAIVDNYRDIISSVGAYSYNGTDQCSGVLLNNTRNDCTPYFLTAGHCGVSDVNSPSVVVYWNYENSFCRPPFSQQSGQPGNGSRTDFNTGSVVRALWGISDFTLIELDDPINPEHNLFFAGWSRQLELPDSSVCIHHPGVEEKRISFEFDKLFYDPTGSDTTHILVQDWDIGTTEGGSSGSPLFNTQKQVVGQLEGGFAACGNNDSDSFGWFRRSWEGEGQPLTSLKFWLDPDQTDVISIEGRSCSFFVNMESNYFEVCGLDQNLLSIGLSPGGLFNDQVEYSIVDVPTGLSATFDFVNGPYNQENHINIEGFSDLESQELKVTFSVSDGNNETLTEIRVLVNDDLPEVPLQINPIEDAKDISLNYTFKVEADPTSKTRIQITIDPNFTNPNFDKVIEGNEINVQNLNENSIYYWRVQAINLCGVSEWSPSMSFSTSLLFCTIFHSSDGPLEISAVGPSITSSTISCPYGVAVEDVNIPNVNGLHEFVSDVELRLKFNSNTSLLFTEICTDENNFDLGFDDRSLDQNILCPPTNRDIYKPQTPLDIFNGSFAGGDWILEVEDFAFLDGGELMGWSIQICYSNPELPVLIPGDHQVYLCGDENFEFENYFDFQGITNYDLRMYDEATKEIDVEFEELDSKANHILIRIKDNSQVVLESGVYKIEIIDRDHNSKIAQTFITIIKLETVDKAIINYPSQDVIIHPDSLSQIEWISDYKGGYTVDLAEDPEFENIVWSASGKDATEEELDLNLLNGEYFLRVVLDDNPCYVTSEIVRFNVDSGTFTDEQDLGKIEIFPNPAREYIHLKSDFDLWNKTILFDIYGRQFEMELGPRQNASRTMDIRKLTPGVYFIKIKNGDEYFEGKFVKI